LDIALYAAMAIGALVLVSTAAVAGVLIWKGGALTGSARKAWASGLMLAGTFGALTGMIMGQRLSHSVGRPTDDRTVPFFGWSLSAGDLRISHFLALHAMFAIPAIGAVARRLVGERLADQVVGIAATLWTVSIVAALVNALAGNGL
jgi:hypothetical protein